jgi:Protein of unknown function (DUF2512)
VPVNRSRRRFFFVLTGILKSRKRKERKGMDSLIAKLIISPLIVVLADALFPEVHFDSLYHSIGVGFTLAVVGYFVDRSMLHPGSLWMTTAADFIVGFLVVYGSLFILPMAQISAIGAGFVATFYGIGEYLQHRWLISARRSEEEES